MDHSRNFTLGIAKWEPKATQLTPTRGGHRLRGRAGGVILHGENLPYALSRPGYQPYFGDKKLHTLCKKGPTTSNKNYCDLIQGDSLIQCVENTNLFSWCIASDS